MQTSIKYSWQRFCMSLCRDTAIYAMLDSDWLAVKHAYDQWLAPQNFDAGGEQRSRLSQLTKAAKAHIQLDRVLSKL